MKPILWKETKFMYGFLKQKEHSMQNFSKFSPLQYLLRKLGRGVARNFLEGDSKSSKISTTMVGQQRGFGMRNG